MLAGFESVPWGKSSSAKFRSGPAARDTYGNTAVSNLLNAAEPVPMGQPSVADLDKQMEDEMAKNPRPFGDDGIMPGPDGRYRRVTGKRPVQGIAPGTDGVIYDGETVDEQGRIQRDVTVSDGIDGGGLMPPSMPPAGRPFGDDFVMPPVGPDSWSMPGRPTGPGPGGDIGSMPVLKRDPQDVKTVTTPQSLDELIQMLMSGLGQGGLPTPDVLPDTDPPAFVHGGPGTGMRSSSPVIRGQKYPVNW